MGLTLTIGEFEFTPLPKQRRVQSGAKSHSSNDAPVNSSGTKLSECWPNSVVWKQFLEDHGLIDVFFGTKDSNFWKDEDGNERYGLMIESPGSEALNKAHLKRFIRARQEYLKSGQVILVAGEEDYALRRLDWLIYWTDWALKNCEYPTFANR